MSFRRHHIVVGPDPAPRLDRRWALPGKCLFIEGELTDVDIQVGGSEIVVEANGTAEQLAHLTVGPPDGNRLGAVVKYSLHAQPSGRTKISVGNGRNIQVGNRHINVNGPADIEITAGDPEPEVRVTVPLGTTIVSQGLQGDNNTIGDTQGVLNLNAAEDSGHTIGDVSGLRLTAGEDASVEVAAVTTEVEVYLEEDATVTIERGDVPRFVAELRDDATLVYHGTADTAHLTLRDDAVATLDSVTSRLVASLRPDSELEVLSGGPLHAEVTAVGDAEADLHCTVTSGKLTAKDDAVIRVDGLDRASTTVRKSDGGRVKIRKTF